MLADVPRPKQRRGVDVDAPQPCGERTTKPGHASRHPLDASAKVYRRHQEAVKVDFKDLNFNVGMLPAEAP
ncbi:hypothetical protein Mkiyose1384_39530 [Mycobacterium kiyosense]|nr:hypothetical protein IWGMT90018_16760 [Mycobacterium kiyosense]GLB96709.1 hypothetical protein SRL2020226_34850 [Mycobacterium kiyosense]GLD08556.1 hypothetical protein Mkiyose1383_48820 [Mycobacterium kiyosense]GLD13729.1 hypothetical protein Mkiyose1384_39530 [Mycobacterium kiyosense]GLD19673.1 hypothetical protein Mkiyose1385_37720 [Mycobacterium kiyosense]